jgi:hypothetical protein
MAGDWIKMRTDLDEDPAVIAMARTLKKVDVFGVVGRLHKVWSWATNHLSDGRAASDLMSFIDDHTRTPGFAKAMLDGGWLAVDGEEMVFPKWDRHLSKGAKQRGLDTERKRTGRAEPVPEMSGSDPDKTVTREEKRRVEIENNTPPSPSEGVPENKSPRPKSTSILPAGFLRFWAAYPATARRANRTGCAQKWQRHGFEEVADEIVRHVEACAKSDQWLKGMEPGAEKYLNQRLWESPPPPSKAIETSAPTANIPSSWGRKLAGENIQLPPEQEATYAAWRSQGKAGDK